ncbi:MAG: hypothetical protein A4E27_00312 [Methanobacterium sp. PtaU1.Bin242]|nr:MAG: hypothetical protein A4E27_00312 [Methanobacterium sp. PtaU1.Bin242]
MTEQEKGELEDIFNISIYSTEYLSHETYTDLFKRKLIEFMEKKKKEWQESGALKMLNYCREISDGSISPMYLQSEKEFEQEFLEDSGIRP